MYVKDDYLNTVLENYFLESSKKEDNGKICIDKNNKVIFDKDKDDESVEESIIITENKFTDIIKNGINKMKKASEEAIKKDQVNVYELIKNAMDREKFKHYVILFYIRYTNVNGVNIATGSQFVLYGSNVKEFTSQDKKKFPIFKVWKKEMEAKKIKSINSIVTSLSKVDSKIKKYIL